MIAIYLDKESWLHRLPAGVKLLVVAVVSIVLFQLDSVWVFLGGLAGVFALYASLGKDGLARLSVIRGLLMFFGIVLVLHWLSGTFFEGIVVVMRLTILFLAANLISITTRMDDMMEALMPLFKPLQWFGVQPRRFALGVTLVLRFAPHLMQIFAILREAYQARTGSRNSWRLLAPFAIHALRMSDNVAEALKARGGSAGLSR